MDLYSKAKLQIEGGTKDGADFNLNTMKIGMTCITGDVYWGCDWMVDTDLRNDFSWLGELAATCMRCYRFN